MIKRYVRASNIKESTLLRILPTGFCQWCGCELTGRQKWWCRPKHRRKFYDYWLSVPKWKRAAYLHDQFVCQNCGVEPLTENEYGVQMPDLAKLEIDHCIPVSRGGSSDPANLQVLCCGCNSDKRARLPDYVEE